MKTNWYIVRSLSNRERSVSERIKKESEENGQLEKIVTDVVVPIENSYYLKDGKKIKREKVMFPGYIFVECLAPSELKQHLRKITGAIGFLKSRSGEIQSLNESEVKRMLGIQEEAKEKDVVDTFLVDEQVKIIDGPFSSMKGTIDKIVGDKIKVSVSIFGRKTPIELKPYQIDKIKS